MRVQYNNGNLIVFESGNEIQVADNATKEFQLSSDLKNLLFITSNDKYKNFQGDLYIKSENNDPILIQKNATLIYTTSDLKRICYMETTTDIRHRTLFILEDLITKIKIDEDVYLASYKTGKNSDYQLFYCKCKLIDGYKNYYSLYWYDESRQIEKIIDNVSDYTYKADIKDDLIISCELHSEDASNNNFALLKNKEVTGYYSTNEFSSYIELLKSVVSFKVTPEIKKDYVFRFRKSPSRRYFMALQLSKAAMKHEIIESHYPDDDTINHIVTFSSEQLLEASLLHYCIEGSSNNFSGWAIYGEDISEIQRICEPNHGDCVKYRGHNNYYLMTLDNEYRSNLERVRDLLLEHHNLNSMGQLSELLRETYQKPYYHFDEFEVYPALGGKEKFKETYKQMEANYVENNLIPVKWKSENELFLLVRKFYRTACIHHSPKWLSPQHLDIFIPELNVALEYQGIQHILPVEHFGGKERYFKQLELDNKKKKKCAENGVQLIEWMYNESITKSILTTKLKQIGIILK